MNIITTRILYVEPWALVYLQNDFQFNSCSNEVIKVFVKDICIHTQAYMHMN